MASHGVFIRGWSDPFNRRDKRGQEDAPQLTVIKQAWDANPKPFATIHLKGLLDSWELSAFAASAVTLGRARAVKVKMWTQEGRLVTGPLSHYSDSHIRLACWPLSLDYIWYSRKPSWAREQPSLHALSTSLEDCGAVVLNLWVLTPLTNLCLQKYLQCSL